MCLESPDCSKRSRTNGAKYGCYNVVSEPNLRAKDQSSAQTEFELHVAVVLSRHVAYSLSPPLH